MDHSRFGEMVRQLNGRANRYVQPPRNCAIIGAIGILLRKIKEMRVATIDHVNIETDDPDRSAKFYSEVLGLSAGDRPEFDRPGYWMYINGKPVVHIITPHEGNAMLTGSKDAAISHFALQIEDFEEARADLDKLGIKYHEADVPGTAMRQLFFPDPDGVLVELLHIPAGAR